MFKPWSAFPTLCGGVLLLGACSNSVQQSTTTPLQAATWEAGGICSTRIPAVKMERVEPDGRYWWRGTTDSNAYTRTFQECVGTERAKIMYGKAEPKELLRKAYLTKASPASTDTLISGPPAVTNFQVDQPVFLYFELNKSGRATAAKFKWYDPAGTVAYQNERALRDGSGGTGGWTWFTERLPSASVRQPGQWTLEIAFDEQVVGRYPFTVSQQ